MTLGRKIDGLVRDIGHIQTDKVQPPNPIIRTRIYVKSPYCFDHERLRKLSIQAMTCLEWINVPIKSSQFSYLASAVIYLTL